MDVFNPVILFVILGLFFLGQGVIYAYQIKHTPVTAGWTVLSVATGFGLIFSGIILITLALSSFGLITAKDATLFIYTLIIVGVLFGGPMFVTQLLKKLKSDKTVKNINDSHDFTNEL